MTDSDAIGRSPLMYAVAYQQYEVIRTLVELGADTNQASHGEYMIG